MLRLIVLSCALAAVAQAFDSSVPHGEEFVRWAQTHSKDYSTEEEATQRFNTFLDNRAYVNRHNEEVARGLHTYTMALNRFADMSNAEYRATMLGTSRSRRPSQAQSTFMASVTPPDSWDWRSHGIVTAVKDQAQCGSCWAFSAVASMEAAFNKKNNGTIPSMCSTKCGPNSTPCCSFSEQEIVDCTLKGTCNCKLGGEMHDGYLEIIHQQKGVINTETQYPYTSGGGNSPGVCHAKATGVQTKFKSYANVTHGDETALKAASYEQTVISVGIDASVQSFQFYSQGVYNEPECKSSIDDLDHGVAVVGYGTFSGPSPTPGPPGPPGPGPANCPDNNSEAKCDAEAGCHWCQALGAGFCFSFPCGQGPVNAQDLALQAIPALRNSTGTDYWLVKNSWGQGWGTQSGYILMSRGKDNQCGIASDAQYPLF